MKKVRNVEGGNKDKWWLVVFKDGEQATSESLMIQLLFRLELDRSCLSNRM